MEFEDLQKIWDTQSQESLYAINEKALHQRILAKKKQAGRISRFSEMTLILATVGSGSILLELEFTQPKGSIFLYIMAAWMYVTAAYVGVSRARRIKGERQFDRTMLGDLDHALWVATYQVRLSQLMRWNMPILGALLLLSVWDTGKPAWTIALLLAIFTLAYFLSDWEHRCYQSRKHELEVLRGKLTNG